MKNSLAVVCCPVKSFCTILRVRLLTVFFKNRIEIFELIGSGFVVVDNFHSEFLV